MRKVCIGVLAAALGCVSDGEGASSSALRAGAEAPRCNTQLIPWGQERDQLGLVPAGLERAARGPLAVAIDGADTLVLDNERARVLRVAPDGASRVAISGLDRTATDVAVGRDGTIAAFSPLRGRVQLYDGSGGSLGALTVPRALRAVSRIELEPGRRVVAYSAYQERYSLGGPSAPLAFESTLRSRLEGAHRSETGLAVTAVARGGAARLQILRAPEDGRRAVLSHELPIPHQPDAAQIVGGRGPLVCARTENIDPGRTQIAVERRLQCVNSSTGVWNVDRPLPEVGVYLPHRELSIDADAESLRFVHARPTELGLELERCEVAL